MHRRMPSEPCRTCVCVLSERVCGCSECGGSVRGEVHHRVKQQQQQQRVHHHRASRDAVASVLGRDDVCWGIQHHHHHHHHPQHDVATETTPTPSTVVVTTWEAGARRWGSDDGT